MAKTVLGDRRPIFNTDEVIRQRQERAENTKKIIPKRTNEEAKKIITANKGIIKPLPKIDTTIDRKNRPKTEFKTEKPYIYTPSNIRTGRSTYGIDFESVKTPDEYINKNSPFSAYKITSKSGVRLAPTRGASTNHAGIDREMPIGTDISLPMDTVFLGAGYDSARGNWIEVKDESGNILHYQHLKDYGSFTPGQKITKGQAIARSGSSGVGSGAHLHEEYYSPDGKNITESYWAKYAPKGETVDAPTSDDHWTEFKKKYDDAKSRTTEEYYNRRRKEEIERLTKEGYHGPIGAAADDIVLKEIQIAKNKANELAALLGLDGAQRPEEENVYKRYNIIPDTFGYKELGEWAEKHNFIVDRDDAGREYFYPKKNGDFLGFGGEKLTTEQEEEDLKVLQNLAIKNDRQSKFGNPNVYKYINDIDGYRKKTDESYLAGNSVNPLEKYKLLTEKEIEVYNKIYTSEGKVASERYLKLLDERVQERVYEKSIKDSEELAKEHPTFASATSVIFAPAYGLGGVIENTKDTIKTVKGQEIDRYSNFKISSKARNAMRNKVSKEYASKWFNETNLPIVGNAGEMAYNLLMSFGDMAMSIAAGGGSSAVSSLMMAGGAMSDSVNNALENGYTDEQAVALGWISGAAEFVFEKISIEKIMKPSKSVLGKMLKSMAAEAQEESVTELANIVADWLIAGDNSEFDRNVRNLVAQGMPEKEAIKSTLNSYACQILSAGISGAIMGGAMSGTIDVGRAVNNKVFGENISESLKNMSSEELQKVKTAFANINEKAKSGAYDNITEEQFNSDEDVMTVKDIVKFSVKTLSKGRQYVQAEKQVIKSENPDDWEGEIINYVNETVRKGKDVVITTADGEDITITGRTAWKLGDKGTYDNDLYFVKGNASGVVDEIISISKGKKYKPSFKEHSDDFGKDGFRYKTAYFRDLDGGYYKLWLSAGINSEGKEMYNIGKIEKVPFPVSGSKATTGTALSIDSIHRNGENVNRNFGETQRKFFDVFGVKVEMDESLDSNAKILLFDGVVKVSPYASIDDWAITRHEFTHLLKMQYPEAYEVYARIAKQEIGDRWDSLYAETKKAYEEYAKKHPEDIKKVTPELIEEEVLSRYAEGFDNNAFIEKVVAENATIGAKIRNFINNLIKKIKSLFSKSDLKANSENIKKLVTAKQAWEDAVLRAAQNGKIKFKGKGTDGVRYSKENDISIKEQLKQYKDELDAIDVIANISTSIEFKNTKEAYLWAVEQLKQSGYKTERKDFGTVLFDEKRIKNGLQYLKTMPEYTAYALIPKVIKRGIVIGGHPNHKNRGYDTITFAAPVEIDGIRGNMAIVVRMEGKNYYKLHRVLMPDGGLFMYNKKSNAETAAATTSVVDTPTDIASKNSIRYPEENVNSNFSPSTPDKLQKLESENAHLKEVNSILKRFFRQTAMVHVDALHISEIAEDVKKRYETHMPARDIGSELQRIYSKMAEDGARAETDKERADAATRGANELYSLAEKILEQSDFVDRTMYNTYADLRQELRTVGISISEQDSHDIPDFRDFVRMNFGRVKITKDGINVDSYYEELIEKYPEFFASEDITAPSDRLLKIVEVRDSLDPVYREEAYTDEEASALAVELYAEYFSDKNAAFEQQSLAKMIKDKYATSLREEYNNKLKKTVDFYREQIKFYKNVSQAVEDRVSKIESADNRSGFVDTELSGNFKWYESGLKGTGIKFIRRRSPGGKKDTVLMTFDRPTREKLRANSEYIDIIDRVKNRFIHNWEDGKSEKTQFAYGRSNIWRSFRRFFGDRDYRKMKELILDPLEDSKKQFMHIQEFYSELIYKKVVKELGIKKGSELSALVQKYGEKTLTEEEMGQISEKDLEKIKTADRLFRACYDGLIDTINDTRRAIYPDADEKAKTLEDEILKLEREIGLIELGFMTGDFTDVKGFDSYNLERIAIRQESAKELGLRIKLNAEQRAAAFDKKIQSVEEAMSSAKDKTTKRYADLSERLSRFQTEKAKWNAIAESKLSEIEEEIQALSEEFKSNTAFYKQKLDKRLKRLNERLGEKEALLKADDITYGRTIQKRKDYYRHFQDLASEVPVFFGYIQQMTQDKGKTVIQAAKEYFENRGQKSNIDNRLAGKSADTKPRAKWQSFAQHRTEGATAQKYDAVGGFLEYLPAAAYSAAIDPQISIFRTIAEDLAEKVEWKNNSNNLGSFIGYLTEYANDLAGKTHAIDRVIVDSFMSRDIWKKLNWVTGRIKSNMIGFNVSSMFAQILNLPNAIATIKDPVCFIGAMRDVVSGITNKNGNVAERYKYSQFLNERYKNYYAKFETGFSGNARKVSDFMLQAFDELGGRIIWNAAYRKGLKNKVSSPTRYADDLTRRMIAGRGIGEMQLYQKSRLLGMVMPFSVEVANNWDVIEDIAKDAAESGRNRIVFKKIAVTAGEGALGLLLLMIANRLFNELLERLRGSDGGLLDPLGAIEEGLKNGDGIDKILGSIAGDAIGATPVGSAVASLYPEQGMQIGDLSTPTRSELFGSNDPTRYGTGSMFSSALKKPLNYLAMPGGGGQLDKTVTAYKALKDGAVKNKKGVAQYEVNKSPVNAIKGLLFGKSGFKETNEYYNTKDSKGIYNKYLKAKTGRKTTAEQSELERLIKIDDSLKIGKPPTSFEYNDVEYKPSGKYYETYEKMYGTRADKYYKTLMSTDEYKSANDELKAIMVKDAFKTALSDTKSAYAKWVKNYGSDASKAVYDQEFKSDFAGKKIVGNNDKSISYSSEGFTKGKGYVEVEISGEDYILQGDAYNTYEKARYDAYSEKSELLNKSGTMTIKNESGAKSNVTKMKAILNQLISEGVLESDVAKAMYAKYAKGFEVEVPIGVEFIVGRQEEYDVEYENLTKADKNKINKSLKTKVKNKEMTNEEAKQYAANLMSGKVKYTKKRYITGDFNSLSEEQQKKILSTLNDKAKDSALAAVKGYLK